MGYPPQYPPQGQPPQGYGQPPQPGYAPQAPQGYAPQAPAGYGQPAAPAGGTSFAQMYQNADHSKGGGGGMPNGEWAAIVTESAFDRTRGGDKWCWTIKFTGTSPEVAGQRMTDTITISPESQAAMGIMFRHLAAMGLPVPPPLGDPAVPPFWDQVQVPQGYTADQEQQIVGQYAAQLMTGRPCRILVAERPAHGEYAARQEVKDIRPPRPGDPTSLPQPGQAAPQQGYAPPQQPPAMGGYQPGPVAQGYAQPPAQPVGPGGQPPWGGQPPQAQQQQQWAQPPQAPPQPGQPGLGQFAPPPGQAAPMVSPPPAGPQYQANGTPVPPQQAQPPAPPAQGQPQQGPPAPPWQQPQG